MTATTTGGASEQPQPQPPRRLRIDDPTNTSPVLLTLPPSDFPVPPASAENGSKKDDDDDDCKEEEDEEDEYLLIQLPPKADLNAFVSSLTSSASNSVSGGFNVGGGAYIVGPSADDGDDAASGGGTAAAAGAGASKIQQACLVIEGDSKNEGTSYSLCKVETSNALVLVPPQQPQPPSSQQKTANAAVAADDEDEKGESPAKKRRTAAPPPTAEVRARLLTPGGSGASFLDLRPHPLDARLLRAKLSEVVYDPYNKDDGSNASVGWSVPTLARLLRVSQSQVQTALRAMGRGGAGSSMFGAAFELPPTNNSARSGLYGTLAEEARDDACMGIVSVLAECDEYQDVFAACGAANGAASAASGDGDKRRRVGKPVRVDEFVDQVVQRSREAEGDDGAAGRHLDGTVVKHCLRLCSAADADGDEEEEEGTVRLDLDKISLILAHHLFNSKSAPWEARTFASVWQRLMPCVGEASAPDLDLLREAGVAIRRSGEELGPEGARDAAAAAAAGGAAGALVDRTNDVLGGGGGEGGGDGTTAKGSNAGDAGGDGSTTAEVCYLRYLPEHRLPTDPAKRFRVLFREKERWSPKEISPYVVRLVEEAGVSKEELLMRYTVFTTAVDQGGGYHAEK